jgi:hypothetical protein
MDVHEFDARLKNITAIKDESERCEALDSTIAALPTLKSKYRSSRLDAVIDAMESFTDRELLSLQLANTAYALGAMRPKDPLPRLERIESFVEGFSNEAYYHRVFGGLARGGIEALKGLRSIQVTRFRQYMSLAGVRVGVNPELLAVAISRLGQAVPALDYRERTNCYDDLVKLARRHLGNDPKAYFAAIFGLSEGLASLPLADISQRRKALRDLADGLISDKFYPHPRSCEPSSFDCHRQIDRRTIPEKCSHRQISCEIRPSYQAGGPSKKRARHAIKSAWEFSETPVLNLFSRKSGLEPIFSVCSQPMWF